MLLIATLNAEPSSAKAQFCSVQIHIESKTRLAAHSLNLAELTAEVITTSNENSKKTSATSVVV